MNFLAHLVLADRAGLPLSGAILGDVVRGRLEARFPEALEASLALHRRIDVATDAHAVVVTAREAFGDCTRRFAGIVLDVLWDHCLAQDWPLAEPFEPFVQRASLALADEAHWQLAADQPAPEVARFAALLRSYREPAGIDAAFARLARRLSRPEGLLAAAEDWRTRLPALRQAFPALYADLAGLADATAGSRR